MLLNETVIHSMTRTRIYSERGVEYRSTATVKYYALGKQAPYLSVTADTYRRQTPRHKWEEDSFGVLDIDRCKRLFPALAKYVPFHLWGPLPMHYEANALYWFIAYRGIGEYSARATLNNDYDYTDQLKPCRLTDAQCTAKVLNILKSHVGFGMLPDDKPEVFDTLKPQEFKDWLRGRECGLRAKFEGIIAELAEDAKVR